MEPRTVIGSRAVRGFTLIELLLVMVIVALLAALVVPVVTGGILRARESTLRHDLYTIRKALDDYRADHGKYPDELEDLVAKRYLRRVPVDPLTERRDSWLVIRADASAGHSAGIVDIASGSNDTATDGSRYGDW